MECNIINLSRKSTNEDFLRKNQEIEAGSSPIGGIAKSAMEQINSHYQSSISHPTGSDKAGKTEQNLDYPFLSVDKGKRKKLKLNLPKFSLQSDERELQASFNELRAKTEMMYSQWGEEAGQEKIEWLSCNQSCRFEDIVCPVATWVKIGSPNGLYLHANYVSLADMTCIAMQYPLHVSLFWMLCHPHALVVDLTNQGDMQKGLVPYVPLSKGEAFTKEGMTLHCTDEKALTFNATQYCYSIHNGEKTFDVTRLHYTGWDDHKGLDDRLSELNEIVDLIEEAAIKNQQIIVHCRAGVGRTGTVLVAAALKRLIRQGRVDHVHLHSTIGKLILEARRQRGRECVQTFAQYRTIWESGQNWLKNQLAPLNHV